jgi:hypothetical protein
MRLPSFNGLSASSIDASIGTQSIGLAFRLPGLMQATQP